MTGDRILRWTAPHAKLLTGFALALVALLVWPDIAWAHDCSGPQDCEQTAGYNAVVSLVGAVSAVAAGVLGSSIGSSTTVPGSPPPGRRPTGNLRGPLVEGVEEDPDRRGPLEEGVEEDPDRRTGPLTEGGYEELPPGSEGWAVTGSDGKDHIFGSEEEANRYHTDLMAEYEAEQEVEWERERVRRLEGDYRNAAEQVGFLDSVIQGLKNAGRDATEQIRDRDRYIRERDQLRGDVAQAGGNTDHQLTRRSPFKFGEHDAMIAEHKDNQRRLETIHKMDDAIIRMRDRGMVGENPNLTNKMLDRLEEMSNRMMDPNAKEPTWEEIKQLQGLVRQDMDATNARNESNQDNWVRDGALDTSREVFTGVDSDGNTSYKSMALRGLLAAASGGSTEIGMEVGDKMYGIHDDVMAGKSGLDAYGNAIKRVFVDEAIGRGVEGGLKVGGRAGSEVYERTLKGTDLDDHLRRGLKSADEFLNRDVKDLVRGSGDEIAEGMQPRVPRSGADPNLRTGAEPDVSHGGRNFDQRQADFETGRANGAQKVNDLDEALANRRTNPGPEADAQVRNAVDNVQGDKHAMHELNSRGGDNPDPMIEGFNRDLGDSYETAHQTSRQRIADEYGVPVEDVKVVKPTNDPNAPPSPADPRGFASKPDGSVRTDAGDYTQRPPDTQLEVKTEKASFDQDVTYRVRQDNVIDPRTGHAEPGFADVPRTDSQRVYNEEFYRARHDGDLPTRTDGSIDTDAVNRYADDMDQACTDRLDAEAYGTGDKDLKTAVDPHHRGDAFDDVEGVGKTMEHKNTEWQNRAADTRADANAMDARANTLEADGRIDEAATARSDASELHEAAEAQIEEGYRQTTKQFHNQIETRIDALNQQHGRVVAEMPPKLQEAIGIMENPNLSPAGVERELARIGTNPNQVAQQMSSNLEALQKFTPPPAGAPNAGFDWGRAAEDFTHGASRSGPN